MDNLIVFGVLGLVLLGFYLLGRRERKKTLTIICPSCEGTKVHMMENFVDKIEQQHHGGIVSQTDFVMHRKQEIRCLSCGHKWKRTFRERT